MLTSRTGAPKDYAELYEHYFPMMRSIVAKAGIVHGDVEDVAMDILCKFMERDALSWYDPNLLHDVGNHPRLEGERLRPAKFQGLLRRFTSLYVRQHLDRQALRTRREPHRLEEPVGAEGATWVEVHGDWASSDPHEEYVRSLEALRVMRTALARLTAEAIEWETETELTTGHERVHAMRREANLRRAADALRTALSIAEGELHGESCDRMNCRCENVSAAAIGRIMGWSSASASTALKSVRETLASEMTA